MNDPNWQWSSLADVGPGLAGGAVVSLMLAALAAAIATPAGIGLGLALTSRGRAMQYVAAGPARLLVRGLRAVPLPVLLILVHLAAPQVSARVQEVLASLVTSLRPHAGGLETAVLDAATETAFASALVALSLALTGRVAEIVAASVRGIPEAVLEAARSQGMTRSMIVRRVVVPMSLEDSIPAVFRAYLFTLGATSLAAFIGCRELLHAALAAGEETDHTAALLALTAGVYLVVLLPLGMVTRHMERDRRQVVREEDRR